MLEQIITITAWILGVWLTTFLGLTILRFWYNIKSSKDLIVLQVTMPRQDSQKDKEKETEKDFREKIGVMEQFYRNLHEIKELNLYNRIKTWLLHSEKISFELVVKNKVIYFNVVTPPEYKNLIEKQITSYYPDADIQFFTEKFEVFNKAEGDKLRAYFAYECQEFYKPIKTYKTIENDPLNNITNVLTKLEDDEKGAIQMIIRPRNDKWSKKAIAAGEQIFKGKKSSGLKIPGLSGLHNLLISLFFGYDQAKKLSGAEGSGGGYVRMLQTKEEDAKKIGEKGRQPGYTVTIRLLASAKSEQRAIEISNNMVLGLNLFQISTLNWFQTLRVFIIDSINDWWLHFGFKHRIEGFRLLGIGEKRSIMVPEELASVFHFPYSRYNYTPAIKWLQYKVLSAPPELPNEGILLGYNVYRGNKREVRMLKNDRTRHFYCIGKSGSGKSAFLSWCIRQDMWNGDGVGVIDPHGDLIEDVLQYVPKERVKDVIVFNPADQERPMGLNILEAKTPAEMDMASSQATEIFIKLFGDEIFGPRIQHYFRNACLTLMEDQEEGATLIDVPRMFVDEEFMKYKVSKVKNPVVRSFWEHEYAHTGERERQEMIPYFSSKFGPFITNSIMRNTIGQQKSAFNFRECMDQKKILLVNLSKGKIGDLNTQLLGLVCVARLQMAAMSRVDIPEEDRHDFFLYVDEFQNFATDSFCSILSEARKYRLALIMAHQYIKQLEKKSDTSIRDAVFGNVGSMMSFKVGADDAEYMAKEYAPVLSEQDVLGIANYKAYIRLNIKNTTSRVFSLETIWDTSKANKKIAGIAKEYSRMKYGRKLEFVDQEITARIGIDLNAPPKEINFNQGQAGAPGAMPGMPGMPGATDGMPGGMPGADQMGAMMNNMMANEESAPPAEE